MTPAEMAFAAWRDLASRFDRLMDVLEQPASRAPTAPVEPDPFDALDDEPSPSAPPLHPPQSLQGSNDGTVPALKREEEKRSTTHTLNLSSLSPETRALSMTAQDRTPADGAESADAIPPEASFPQVAHKFSTSPSGSAGGLADDPTRHMRAELGALCELRASPRELDQWAHELVTDGLPLAGSMDRLVGLVRYAVDRLPDGVTHPLRYVRATVLGPRGILRQPPDEQPDVTLYLRPPEPVPDYMRPPEPPAVVVCLPPGEARRRTQAAIDKLRTPRPHLLKQA